MSPSALTYSCVIIRCQHDSTSLRQQRSRQNPLQQHDLCWSACENHEPQSDSAVSAASLIRTETAFAARRCCSSALGVGLLASTSRSSDSAVSAVKWLINYLIWFRGLNTAAGLYSAIVPFEIESHISSYETRHHLPFSGIMKEYLCKL